VAVVCLGVSHCTAERLVVIKTLILNATVDARDVLHHHKPGAEVEMTDFGVPHLAGWQSHMLLCSRNIRCWTFGLPLIEVRRIGLLDRVANGVGSFAKTIENCEEYGSWAVV